MEFNIQKFLIENKLTKRSLLSEDDNTGAILRTGGGQDEISDEEDNEYEVADNWNKPEVDYTDEFEKEPSSRDISGEEVPETVNVVEMEAELKRLEDQKDKLLNQWRIGKLTTSQYKQAIGDIPTDIQNLRADIEKAKTVSIDDEESEF